MFFAAALEGGSGQCQSGTASGGACVLADLLPASILTGCRGNVMIASLVIHCCCMRCFSQCGKHLLGMGGALRGGWVQEVDTILLSGLQGCFSPPATADTGRLSVTRSLTLTQRVKQNAFVN